MHNKVSNCRSFQVKGLPERGDARGSREVNGVFAFRLPTSL